MTSGDYVEFRAVLRKNPLVGNLEGFVQAVAVLESVTRLNSDNKSQTEQMATLGKQMASILKIVRQDGPVDLVAELTGSRGLRAVLMVDANYFNDPSLNDLIDGEFWVLGKITRVIKVKSEGVNLFRKSGLARLPEGTLSALESAFDKAGESGMDFSKTETTISGPVIQVIPVAMFS
ncbi:MAG: hypothetical protein WED85_02735 [Dehalococcoidia bacterium]